MNTSDVKRQGRFISLEGLDGSGKTTQAAMLYQWLLAKGEKSFLTREPSEGPIGALIRQILSRRILVPPLEPGGEYQEVGGPSIALLFAADRLDHIQCEIGPRMRRGQHIISDRYVLSSLAYQSFDCPTGWVRQVNQMATSPDLTVYIDVPPTVCLQRLKYSRGRHDAFETLERLQRVGQIYEELLAEFNDETLLIVDGTQRIEEVFEEVKARVLQLIAG